MNNRFQDCLAFTLKYEGGFVNNPRDPGGATRFGITLRTLSAWRGHTCVVADVRNMAVTEAGQIYRHQFWEPIQGDALPAGVALCTFDWAVNSGVTRAIMGLQFALGVEADGHIGLVTTDALRRAAGSPAHLIETICGRRLSFMEALKTWQFFGKGWGVRVDACRVEALKMAGG